MSNPSNGPRGHHLLPTAPMVSLHGQIGGPAFGWSSVAGILPTMTGPAQPMPSHAMIPVRYFPGPALPVSPTFGVAVSHGAPSPNAWSVPPVSNPAVSYSLGFAYPPHQLAYGFQPTLHQHSLLPQTVPSAPAPSSPEHDSSRKGHSKAPPKIVEAPLHAPSISSRRSSRNSGSRTTVSASSSVPRSRKQIAKESQGSSDEEEISLDDAGSSDSGETSSEESNSRGSNVRGRRSARSRGAGRNSADQASKRRIRRRRRKSSKTRDDCNGEKRLSIIFESFGELQQGAPSTPRVGKKGVLPHGLCGSFMMYSERWCFRVEYDAVQKGPEGLPVTCVRWAIRNVNWTDFVTCVESPLDAMKRETRGFTLCNKIFRDAMNRRADEFDEMAETEARKPEPDVVQIESFRSRASFLRPEKISEGPLLFGLRHKAVQDMHRNALAAETQPAASPDHAD